MKRFFTFFVCAAMMCGCVSGNHIISGKAVIIDFPDGIHALDVSGAISVTASADASEMTVTGDSLALESFRYSFSGGTLVLERKSFSSGGIFNPRNVDFGEISVVIPQPAGLSSVSLSGASVFAAEQPLTAGRIAVKLSGAAVLRAEVRTDVLTVKASGASAANLSGIAGEVSYEVSGASRVSSADAYVSAENAELGVSGASKVDLGCNVSVKGNVSGASRVVCYGDAVASLNVSGASHVKTGR